jgi:hypothetical protein
MSKPGKGTYRCPVGQSTPVLRVSSIFVDYWVTLLDLGSGLGVDEEAQIEIWAAGIPPYWTTNFRRAYHFVITGQPYFQVNVKPLTAPPGEQALLVAVS